MAVFTSGTISSIVQAGEQDGEVQNIPLMPPQQLRRNYGKKSKWQRPAFLVGVALAGLILVGIVMLWERHGGDSVENQGTSSGGSSWRSTKSRSTAESIRKEHSKQKLRAMQMGKRTGKGSESKQTHASSHGPNPFSKKVHHGSFTDNKSVKDFNKYIDSQRGPKHTLGKDLRKHGDKSGDPMKRDLKGGEQRDKGKFRETYGQYLDREHGVKEGKTLHGKGIHPSHYRPPVTRPSSGNSFNSWLDKTHPVTRNSPSAHHKEHGSSSVDRTGQEGHLGHGWYKTYNLHAALHHNAPTSEHVVAHQERGRMENREPHDALQHADRTVQRHASESEAHRSNPMTKHFDAQGNHLTLHERNKEMESKKGDYRFLSPTERQVWKTYDAIRESRKARAKETLGLKHLQTVVHQVKEPPLPPPAPPPPAGGYLSQFDGNAGGVLSQFPNDDKLTGGVLSHVGGDVDGNRGGSLHRAERAETDEMQRGNIGGVLYRVRGDDDGNRGGSLHRAERAETDEMKRGNIGGVLSRVRGDDDGNQGGSLHRAERAETDEMRKGNSGGVLSKVPSQRNGANWLDGVGSNR